MRGQLPIKGRLVKPKSFYLLHKNLTCGDMHLHDRMSFTHCRDKLVVFPDNQDSLCCGQMLASKGMAEEADGMSNTLEAALMKASQNGKYPVIMDASACSVRRTLMRLPSVSSSHMRAPPAPQHMPAVPERPISTTSTPAIDATTA